MLINKRKLTIVLLNFSNITNNLFKTKSNSHLYIKFTLNKHFFLLQLFQHRRLSYSRHAVDDRDLATQVSWNEGKIVLL